MWSRLYSAKARLIGAGFALALMSMAGGAAPAMAEGFDQDLGVIRACGGDIWSLCSDVLPDVERIKSCVQNKMGHLSKGCLDKLLDAMAGSTFKVCKDQTYALCAAARCNVFDGVAYCQCDVKHGDSISLPFPMGKDEDVCSINAAGAANKFMVSTYSLPESIASPQGGGAAYTCQGDVAAPTLSAMADCASEAPRRRRSLASTSRSRKDRSSVPAQSRRPVPAAAIRSLGLIHATSPSSNIAKAPPRLTKRVRRSMSAPLQARLLLWPSSSTARSRPSTSARPDAVRNDIDCGRGRDRSGDGPHSGQLPVPVRLAASRRRALRTGADCRPAHRIDPPRPGAGLLA